MASSSRSRGSPALTNVFTDRKCSATEDGVSCRYSCLPENTLCRMHHLLRHDHVEGVFVVEDLPQHLQEHIDAIDGEDQAEPNDYPREGEVWLVVDNWQHGTKRMECHDVVEILNGYREWYGVRVAKLKPAECSGGGGGEIFERETVRGFGLTKNYPKTEMWRFRRRLSAERVPEGDGDGGRKNAWTVAWE